MKSKEKEEKDKQLNMHCACITLVLERTPRGFPKPPPNPFNLAVSLRGARTQVLPPELDEICVDFGLFDDGVMHAECMLGGGAAHTGWRSTM